MCVSTAGAIKEEAQDEIVKWKSSVDRWSEYVNTSNGWMCKKELGVPVKFPKNIGISKNILDGLSDQFLFPPKNTIEERSGARNWDD